MDAEMPLYYWANDKNTSEIDFIIQKWDQVIPLEVKSGFNLKAKSLKAYREMFKPQTVIRSSLSDFRAPNKTPGGKTVIADDTGGLFEIPLYLIGQFTGLVSK
jgi:predicted AAA+ superfamily ATPase